MSHYQNIEGWMNPFHEQIFSKIVQYYPDDSVFVELGSFQGRSACYIGESLVAAGKTLSHLFSIDLWPDADDLANVKDIGGGQGEESQIIQRLNKSIYQIFIDNMIAAGLEEMIMPIRGHTLNVAKVFEDNSASMIYVDACHFYDGVVADINAWQPKLKADGIMVFDDANDPQVERAIQDTLTDVVWLNGCALWPASQWRKINEI